MTASAYVCGGSGLTRPAGVALIASMATLVQSHVALKLGFLSLFLALSGVSMLAGRPVRFQPRLLIFYAALSALGLLWGVVGLVHGGNHVRGVLDAVRLYAMWSAAFVILFTLLRADEGLRIFHWALVTAGIAIPVINALAIADFALGAGMISPATREEMELFVGFHDGYIRLSSINIGAMFLVVPYLLAKRITRRESEPTRGVETIALLLSILLVVVSGRRALWIVVAAAPVLVLVLAQVTALLPHLRRPARRALVGYTLVATAGGALAVTVPELIADTGGVEHLTRAFSSEDERTIQAGFLLRGYAAAPLLGSGFGAYAGYRRSDESPWTYELTYHQMLFNLGTVGSASIAALFIVFMGMVIGNLRRAAPGDSTEFALFIAWISLLVGAYSNPYLRSFDYLFFAGILPWLATFGGGLPPQVRGTAALPQRRSLTDIR